MADDKIIIGVEADTTKLDKNLDTSTKKAKKLGVTGKQAALAAGVGIAAMAAGIHAVINAYKVQEQAEIGLKQALKATGYAAGLTSQELFNMASALQEVTTFGDEAIIGGQSLLLTFRNIGSETFPRATEAMLDMSQAMGQDLKSSAIQLGKALNDPTAGIAALSRVGITFTKQQKDLIKAHQAGGDTARAQAIILKELEQQFGGAAKAAAKGSGSMTQLTNTLGDIAESIGKIVLPSLLKLTKGAKVAADGLAKMFADAAESKSAAEIKKDLDEINIKLAEQDAKVASRANKKGYFGISGTKYLDAMLTEAARLQELYNAKVKEEYLNSDEFKKKVAANETTRVLEAQKLKLAQLAEFNEAKKQLTVDGYRTEEEGQKGFLGRLFTNSAAAAAEEAEAKILRDAAELEAKGEHEKARAMIDKAAKKKKLDDEKSFGNSMQVLANSNFGALAAAGKAYGLLKIAQDTPVAVGSAIRFGTGVGGPVLGGIFGGLAAAAMATQAGKLAGIKGFADSGVVGGFNGATGGPDNQLATVRTGEMFLNAGQQAELFEIANGGGGQSIDVNITINDSLFGDAIEAIVTQRRALGTGSL